MTGILDIAKEAIASSNTARIAHLVKIEQPGQNGVFKFLTDYGRDIKYKGNIYKTDSIKRIGNVKQTKTLNNFTVSVSVSGAVEGEFDAALSSKSLIERRIIIYKAFLDYNDNIIPMFQNGDTIKYFEGIISTVSTRDSVSVSGTGSSLITWSCASALQDFQAVNGRVTDDESHRGLVSKDGTLVPSTAAKRPEYQQDRGFAHANKSVKVLASYQTKEKRYKMKSRRSGGLKGLLGGRNYSMEEYWETVTREVDLDINMTAKYIPVIYGVQKTAGIPIFVDTAKDNPDEVWVVYAFCEGEIDGFLDIYLDDAPLICVDDKIDPEKRVCLGRKRDKGDTISIAIGNPTPPTAPSTHGEHYIYNDGSGDIHFWTYHGKADQEASPVLVDMAAKGGFKLQDRTGPEYWDSSYKLLDTAYIVFKYTLNADRTNIPQISAEVQGRKVTVYKEDGTRDSSKTSLNFTWQTLDYLTNEVFGANVPLVDINLPTFISVGKLQDIVDTSYSQSWVPFWRYIGWTNKTDEHRQIMQGSAYFNTADTVFKNLDVLLQQFDASLNIVGGIYTLSCEAEGKSVADITFDEVIGGQIDTSDTTSKEKFNSVQASIVDPAKGWGTNSITFYNADYKKEDKNKEIKSNIVFPFITNYYTARSRAERVLKRSRYTKRITFSLSFAYFWLYPNANITMTSARHKWDKKKFLIEDVDWSADGKVRISAREYADDVFINSTQTDNSTDQIPDIDVSVLPPRDLQYLPDTENKVEGLNGTLSWLPSITKDVAYYTLRWTGQVQTESVSATGHEDLNSRILYYIMNFPQGMTTFEVRAANFAGIVSKPITLTVDMNATKNLPMVENFRCTNLATTANTFVGSDLRLAWDLLDKDKLQVNKLGYNLQIIDPNTNNTLADVTLYNIDNYAFMLNMNKDAFLRYEKVLGIYRQLTARIRAVGDGGEVSVNWTNL